MACILFLTAILVTVWTDFVFEREMNRFEKELKTIVDIADYTSEKELVEKADVLVLQWEKSSGLLRSIVLHSGVDELGRYITSLPRIIENSGKDELKKICTEAISLIKNLKECETLGIENVL